MKAKLDLLTKRDIINACKEYDFLSSLKVSDYALLRHAADNTAMFWTKDSHFGEVEVCNKYSNKGKNKIVTINQYHTRYSGVLPVIKDKKIYEELNYLFADADEIEFGEYPVSIVDEELNKKLLKLYEEGHFCYTHRHFDKNLVEGYFQEYFYNGNKYIIGYILDKYVEAINRKFDEGPIFFRVEPIKWRNFRKSKMFICESVLNSTVFDIGAHSFNKTEIYSFLERMCNEMTQKIDAREELLLNDIDEKNPLKFKFISINDIYGENKISAVDPNNITISDFAKYTGCNDYYAENRYFGDKSSIQVGYLPVIDYSKIKDQAKVVTNKQYDNMIVEFGEYPLVEVVPLKGLRLFSIIKKDEEKYKTGKRYTYYKQFTFSKAIEYEIDGQKYAKTKDDVWFKVEKLRWSVDLKRDLACCLSVPFAGISYDLNVNVKETDLNRFIIKYFSKEIIPSKKRNIDKINQMVSDDILTQMIMSKENLTADDLELNGDNLVLRR